MDKVRTFAIILVGWVALVLAVVGSMIFADAVGAQSGVTIYESDGSACDWTVVSGIGSICDGDGNPDPPIGFVTEGSFIRSPVFGVGGSSITGTVKMQWDHLSHTQSSDHSIVRLVRSSGAEVVCSGTWYSSHGVWTTTNVRSCTGIQLASGFYYVEFTAGGDRRVDNLSVWFEGDLAPTPTPAPTLTPGEESRYGLTCTYEPITGTAEVIPASIISNGSFESGLSGWYPAVGDTASSGVHGGYWQTIGPASAAGESAERYAVDGEWSAWKDYFSDTDLRSVLLQDVFIKGGSYRLEIGASVIASEVGEPGGRRLAGITHNFLVRDSTSVSTAADPFLQEWTHLSATYNSNGGGFRIGLLAGPGDAGVYYDAVYAYVYERGESGAWELVCPGGDFTEEPDGYEMPDIEEEGGGLDTLPWDDIDTGIEINPGTTECLGIEAQEIGGANIPGFGMCFTEQQIILTSTWLTDYIDLQAVGVLGIVTMVALGIWLFIRSR